MRGGRDVIGRDRGVEKPRWVGEAWTDEDRGRRRLDASCQSYYGQSLDTCLNDVCSLGGGSCSCSGVLNGAYDGLTGDIPTELGRCTDLTQLYVCARPRLSLSLSLPSCLRRHVVCVWGGSWVSSHLVQDPLR